MNWEWLVPITPNTPGSLDDIVSHSEPVAAELRRIGNDIGRRAASNLDVRSRHRTGDSQIVVEHGAGFGPSDLDTYVTLVDHGDGSSKGSAWGIEKEHHVLSDAVEHVSIRYKGSLK